MKSEYTLEGLAAAVRGWCEEHRISPANGQASLELSERTIRYYRTIGLLDAPLGSYVKTFGAKHCLQLIAIRIYQAQGIPLRKIRDELYGKSLADLEQLVERVERAGKNKLHLNPSFGSPTGLESWTMTPLCREFMLISRDGRELPQAVLEKINRLLETIYPDAKPRNEINQN
ncbi:MAG: MerR family transcriptional regulator [Verrucomicrobiota bacterium]|jgi:DNA-binding transcriptional MerR regulator